MKRNSLYPKAVALRHKGDSLDQISKKLRISKSTCSLWLKDVLLGNDASRMLQKRRTLARRKGLEVVLRNRQERNDEITRTVNEDFKNISFSTGLQGLFCALLYWAEGEKNSSRIAFTNSDPAMVKVFLASLRRAFPIREEKWSAVLHVHSYHDSQKQRRYWSKVTNIPIQRISIYQKRNSGKVIHKGYPGCISIRYHDVRLLKKLEAYYKVLIAHYRGIN